MELALAVLTTFCGGSVNPSIDVINAVNGDILLLDQSSQNPRWFFLFYICFATKIDPRTLSVFDETGRLSSPYTLMAPFEHFLSYPFFIAPDVSDPQKLLRFIPRIQNKNKIRIGLQSVRHFGVSLSEANSGLQNNYFDVLLWVLELKNQFETAFQAFSTLFPKYPNQKQAQSAVSGLNFSFLISGHISRQVCPNNIGQPGVYPAYELNYRSIKLEFPDFFNLTDKQIFNIIDQKFSLFITSNEKQAYSK
jgi:hypothetical protein